MSKTRTSLILRVRDPKDNASWTEFHHFYEPLLFSYLRSRGLPQFDAADAVQEIFIRLVRALPNFNLDHGRGRFRTWLYQVSMNVVRDMARRQAAKEKLEKNWWDQFGRTSTADEEPDQDWDRAHLRRALSLAQEQVKAQSNANTWYCFEQRVHHKRPCAEIAEQLGISANAVVVNAKRVFEKVSALCAEKLEELEDV